MATSRRPADDARAARLVTRLARKLGCGTVEAHGAAAEALRARVGPRAALGPRTLRIVDASAEPSEGADVVVVVGASDWPEVERGWSRVGLETACRPAAGEAGVLARLSSDARALLRAGPGSLMLDPAADTLGAGADLSGLRVGFLTYEVAGVRRYGGIGTACLTLAQLLARSGADVEVVYTGLLGEEERANADRWDVPGVRLITVPDDEAAGQESPYWDMRRALDGYRALLARHEEAPFDVVHLPESRGHGMFALAARAAGLDFDGVTMVVGTHGDREYLVRANGRALASPVELVAGHQERASLACADVVMGPTAWLHDELRAQGVVLPERTFVQHNVVRADAPASRDAPRARPEEIVFFGRLDRGKGLPAFLDAIDLLAADPPDRPLTVTFLGAASTYDGEDAREHIARRRVRWPFAVEQHTGCDREGALRHLRERACLVVAPSYHENGPNTVLEAIGLGVPVVSSDRGGIPELVAPEDRARVLAPYVGGDDEIAAGLARTIRRVLDDPRPARFAVDPAATDEAYVRWHASQRSRPAPAVVSEPVPITVIGTADDVPAGAAEHVLLLAEHHRLRPHALATLGRAAARTGAAAIVFASAGGDGGVRVAAGGPAGAAMVDDVLSTGSALVRRDAAVPRTPGLRGPDRLRELLLRIALGGGTILALPHVLVDDDAPPRRPRMATGLYDLDATATFALTEPFGETAGTTARDLAALVRVVAQRAEREADTAEAMRAEYEAAVTWARDVEERLAVALRGREEDAAALGAEIASLRQIAEHETRRAAAAEARLKHLRGRRAVQAALRGAQLRRTMLARFAQPG